MRFAFGADLKGVIDMKPSVAASDLERADCKVLALVLWISTDYDGVKKFFVVSDVAQEQIETAPKASGSSILNDRFIAGLAGGRALNLHRPANSVGHQKYHCSRKAQCHVEHGVGQALLRSSSEEMIGEKFCELPEAGGHSSERE